MKSKEKLQKKVQTEIKKKDVEKALERHWSINADDIHVKAEGSKIILTGNVTSLYQKRKQEKLLGIHQEFGLLTTSLRWNTTILILTKPKISGSLMLPDF